MPKRIVDPVPKLEKPNKPYPDFPLFAHQNGTWAKKIRGRLHYFGAWHDPDAALNRYLEQKDALHAGRSPRPDPEAMTVKALVNDFLNHKQDRVDSGELTQRSWNDYKEVTDLLVSQFGKGRLVDDLAPDDFAKLRNKMTERWGPVRVGNVIQRVRSIFKFATDNGLVEKTVRYGQGFARPSKKTLRLHRASKGLRMFEANELRRILDMAGVQLRAMIYLALNCGFGNADCGTLPTTALDLDAGWVRYPHPKTGIDRRCPLWPETVQALCEAIAQRPTPKDEADAALVFITKYGYGWHKGTKAYPITAEMKKVLDALGMGSGRNFYTLRHTFRTVADETRDQAACDHIMGHARDDMASVYRERISDERLRAVTDHVHTWLFGPQLTGDKV